MVSGKPDLPALAAAVEDALRAGGAVRDGRREARRHAGDSGAWDTEVFDRIEALKSTDGDEAMLMELMRLIEVYVPVTLGDLRGALDAGDAEAARRHAHTVKGQAANIGAHRLRQSAYEAELAAREGRLGVVRELLPRLEKCFTELTGVLARSRQAEKNETGL